MVTTHKISAELYDDSFKLIAVHCNLSSYAMAYNINKAAQLQLKRALFDLDLETLSFPVYEWQDDMSDTNWTLVSNAAKNIEKSPSIGLFSENSAERTHYLIDERKEVDYFLKIETDDETILNTIVLGVKSIPKVITAYSIDLEVLKSKRNLIFL